MEFYCLECSIFFLVLLSHLTVVFLLLVLIRYIGTRLCGYFLRIVTAWLHLGKEVLDNILGICFMSLLFGLKKFQVTCELCKISRLQIRKSQMTPAHTEKRNSWHICPEYSRDVVSFINCFRNSMLPPGLSPAFYLPCLLESVMAAFWIQRFLCS